MKRSLLGFVLLIMVVGLVCAPKAPEDPWARGVCNELVVGRRIEVTPEFLAEWKAAGINAVLRADPASAP